MEDLEKLYGVVSQRGLYTKSFDEFKIKYSSDAAAQKKLFDVVSREGLYTKSENDFKNKYFKQAKPKGVTTEQNTASQSASVNGGSLSASGDVRPKGYEGLTKKPKTFLQQAEEEQRTRPKIGQEQKIDIAEKATEKAIEKKFPHAKVDVLGKKIDTKVKENYYSNTDVDSRWNDIKQPSSKEAMNVLNNYPNLNTSGVNIIDFAQFLKNNTRYFEDKNIDNNNKTESEFVKNKYLQDYIKDRINFLENKLRYTKPEDKNNYNKIVSELNSINDKYEDYVNAYLPEFVKLRDETILKQKENHSKIKNGDLSQYYNDAKNLVERFVKGGTNPILDMINTGLDKVGAENLADKLRVDRNITEYKSNMNNITNAKGSVVNYNNNEYVVTSSGEIIDSDTKTVINSFTDKNTINKIYDLTKKSDKVKTLYSGRGYANSFSDLAGNLTTQILLTKGAASAAAKVGLGVNLSTKVGEITSVFGMVGASTYEQTLQELRDAGITDEVAKTEANKIAALTATASAVSSYFMPNANANKVTQGLNTKLLIKESIDVLKKEGKEGLANFLKTKASKIIYNSPDIIKEGGGEFLQEILEGKAQYIANQNANTEIGKQVLQEGFKEGELLDTFILSATAGSLGASLGKAKEGAFGMDIKENFEYLSNIDINKIDKIGNNLVNSGDITQEEFTNLKNQVLNYRNNKSKLPSNIKGKKAVDATQLIAERENLKQQRKNLDEVFHPEIDAKIESINNQLKGVLSQPETTEDNAVQEQTIVERNEEEINSEESLKTTLDNGVWGMLTAENPEAKKLSEEENAVRNSEAKKWLEEKGYKPKEIKGKYGNEENSFFVPNLSKQDAIEFARTFNQESVATNEGLVYQDGSFNPRIEGVEVGGNYEDFYSTMKIGDKDVSFQVNYNFDEKINEPNQTTTTTEEVTVPNQEGKNTGNDEVLRTNIESPANYKEVAVSEKSRENMTEDGEGNFVFYHYSPVQFDQLDPSKSGSNKSAITSSTETGAWSSAGGVNYLYTRDGQRERMVKGDYGYEFKVPMDKVYDTDADVNNYGEEAERRYAESHNGAKPNANVKTALITQIASENGYQVTVTSWEGTTRAQTNQPLTPNDTLVMNGTKVVKDFTKKYESNYDKKLASEERYDFNTVRDLTNHLQDKYVKSGKMENVVGMQQGAVVKRIMDADIPEVYKKLYVDLLEKEGMTGALNSIPQDTKDRLKQVVIPDNKTVEKMSTPDKAIKMINKMLDDLDKFSKGTAGINIAIPVAKAALQTVKAAIKAGKSISQAIQAGTDYVKNSSWYKNLSDSDKAEFDSKGLIRSIEETQAKQVAETIVKSETVDNKKSTKATVRENTGQTDTSAKVTISESKLLKEKFKNLQRGFKEGVKETNQFKKEFITEVENSIKGLKGLLSSETSRILKAVRDINPNNIVTVQNKIDRLVEIIENKEFYRDMKNVKSDVSKLSKSKSKPQNLTNIAKKAGKVNERYLSKKEASEYKDTLDKIKNGLLPVSNPNYKPFNVEEVLNTLERLNDSANTNQILQLAEDYGFADLGLSEKEIIDLINSENIDEYVDNLEEAKKKQILDNFRNIAKYSQIGLKEKVFQTEISDREKKQFKNLREADLSNMSLQQLKDFTTISDNIIMNEDFSGAGKIDVVVSVKKAGNDIKGRNISVNDIAVDVSNKWLIPSWANPAEWTSSYISHITGINVFLNNMFGRKNGGFIYDKSKALDLSDANTVKAQKEKELREAMSNKMDELSNKYPDIRDNKNNARRAVLAVLLQAEHGNVSDMTRLKEKYIQRSIDNILKSVSSEQAFKQVELMRNILTELENIKTKEELIDYLEKNDKGNFEVLKTVRDFFAKNAQALEEIANNYYNQKFDSRSYDDFYLAIMTKSTVPTSLKKGDSDNIIGGNFGVDIVNLVKTGSLESRKQYAGLRNDTIINLNFDDSVVNKYAEQVYTIEATPTVMYIKEFFSDPQVISTIGINNRIKLMELIGIKIDADSGNKFGNLKNIDKNVIRMERLVRQAGTVWSLGGITQIIKQPMTMMATVIRLGNKAYLLPKAMFSRGDAKEFLKIGSVSLRGDAMGATVRLGDNVNFKNMSLSEKSKIKRLVENIAVGASVTRQKAMEISMKALTYADTYAFESTYIAHYMERLIELGVPESEIDMKTEHLKLDDEVRREARAYALNMANAAQTSTDVSEHSKLTTDQNWTAKVAMSIIMPFSNVSNNSTARLYGAMSRAANTKGEAKEAWNEVIATTLGETLSFHAVKNFVVPYLLGTLYNSFYGEEDEEDKDFNWVFQIIKTVSSTFTDLVPYPEFIEAEAVNWLAYKTQKKEMQENGININNYDDFKNYIKYLPFKDTSDDTYSPAYLYKFEEANNYDTGILSKARDLGIYSVPIDQYKIVSEVYNALFNEKVTRDGKYGKVEHQIAPEHKNFIMVLALVESVNIIAAFDADIRRLMEKQFREIVRESEKKNIKTDGGYSNSKPKKISDSTWGQY